MVSTPSATTAKCSSFAKFIITLRRILLFLSFSILCTNPISNFKTSIGSFASIFREEYPVPKSSISIINPIFLSLLAPSIICSEFSVYADSVISRCKALGDILYFLTNSINKLDRLLLYRFIRDTFTEIERFS